MGKLLLLSSLLLSLAAQECGSKKQTSSSSPTQEKGEQRDLYIRIQRTGCYGRCPIDKVELLPEGIVRYEGERFVPRLGVYTRQLSQAELARAEQLLQKGNFAQYEEVYDNPGISDLPSLILTYRLAGQERSITCRTGCPPALPESIERLRVFLAEEGNFRMEKGPEPEEETTSDPTEND